MLLVVLCFAERLHKHNSRLHHAGHDQQRTQLHCRLPFYQQPIIQARQDSRLRHPVRDRLCLCDDGVLHLIGLAAECFGDPAGLFRSSGIHPVFYQPCRQQEHRQADADPQYLHFLG